MTNKLELIFPTAINHVKDDIRSGEYDMEVFPYCNERNQLESTKFKNQEEVNRAFTSIETIRVLEKLFNVRFSTGNEVTSKSYGNEENGLIYPHEIGNRFLRNLEKGIGSEASNPEEFDKMICRYIKYVTERPPWKVGKLMDVNPFFGRKGILLVSHSDFMTSLVKYYLTDSSNPTLYTSKNLGDNNKYCHTIGFDNLDILHLQYDKTEKEMVNMTIRKFRDYYREPDTEYEGPPEKEPSNGEKIPLREYEYRDSKQHNDVYYKELPEDQSSPVFNVFIMRHCLGCHNIMENKGEKVLAKLKRTVGMSERGWLDWAMCLERTYEEMETRKESLVRLLQKYCFDVNKPFNINHMILGSSVIFRAMLTICLLYVCLKYDKKSVGGKKTKRRRKGRRKIKKSVKKKKTRRRK